MIWTLQSSIALCLPDKLWLGRQRLQPRRNSAQINTWLALGRMSDAQKIPLANQVSRRFRRNLVCNHGVSTHVFQHLRHKGVHLVWLSLFHRNNLNRTKLLKCEIYVFVTISNGHVSFNIATMDHLKIQQYVCGVCQNNRNFWLKCIPCILTPT